MDNIYYKISHDRLYRLLYHYIAFALGVLMAVRADFTRVFAPGRAALFLLPCLAVYTWAYGNPGWSVLAVLCALLIAPCAVSLLIAAHPRLGRAGPWLAAGAAATYELYLVHYAVIEALDQRFHGALAAYPAVFAISILLALAVAAAARPYAGLLQGRRAVARPPRLSPRSRTAARFP